ncbi:choline/ethanolamine kinase isoform X3 [Sitodiplosis mosellana]|uniref:choline/ethanolamine kinase isoform X3 n=1 Tax=Sitodiplosis mosellana TaxID=263140 RepID=UPI0024443036|nr:choline/ethanolamine kinase isoform X3 [Sitodiplosis mosellana]XP_055305717.1 choline/ethanolamine kinase isoform X3 [Sitodiplosis mosellana]
MSSMIKASKNSSEMRELASRICRDYLTGAWKTISASDLHIKRISGGLSNFLYYVSLPDDSDSCNNVKNIKRPRKDASLQEPKEVLLRIYGRTHGEQALETVLTDTVVFTLLSERKLGPKLHGIFPGGRIEQYIPARPLATHELCDAKISCKVAEKMAKIHGLSIPVSKEPDWLWITMDRWLLNFEQVLKNYKTKNTSELEILDEVRKIDFKSELTWLKATVENQGFPVVFCHNDLQEGNILLREQTYGLSSSPSSSTEQLSSFFDDTTILDGHFDRHDSFNGNLNSINKMHSRKRSLSDCPDEDLDNTRDSLLSDQSQFSAEANNEPELMIIDFEYCAYNYRGFDLANHFIEWMIDYTIKEYPFFSYVSEQYPNKEQQERFLKAYLMELSSKPDYSPSTAEIDELKNEVLCFTMASHLFWTLWSFVNVHQDIEFGYWSYGQKRAAAYFAAKEAYIKAKGLDLKRTHTLDDRK